METGIRQRAMAALDERRQHEAREAAENTATRAASLKRVLKELLDIDAEPTTGSIDIDGLHFYTRRGKDLCLTGASHRYEEQIFDWADVGIVLASKETGAMPDALPEPGPSLFESHLFESARQADEAAKDAGESDRATCAIVESNLSIAAAMRALAVETHSHHEFVAYSQ